MYSEEVMKRFKNPKFHKKLKKFNGVGEVGNPQCGDIMRIYIDVEDNIIKDLAVETMGCVAAIASSDMVCDIAKGKTLEEAKKISKMDIVKKLGDLPPLKIHCSVLAHDALIKAIEDYEKKSAA